MTSRSLRWWIAAVSVAGIFLATLVVVSARQSTGGAPVAIDRDDIGGVVTGARGPEAGVWVIPKPGACRPA